MPDLLTRNGEVEVMHTTATECELVHRGHIGQEDRIERQLPCQVCSTEWRRRQRAAEPAVSTSSELRWRQREVSRRSGCTRRASIEKKPDDWSVLLSEANIYRRLDAAVVMLAHNNLWLPVIAVSGIDRLPAHTVDP